MLTLLVMVEKVDQIFTVHTPSLKISCPIDFMNDLMPFVVGH